MNHSQFNVHHRFVQINQRNKRTFISITRSSPISSVFSSCCNSFRPSPWRSSPFIQLIVENIKTMYFTQIIQLFFKYF